MKVVIDTNVMVSALLFGGRTAPIHDLWKSGVLCPILSREILAEYTRTFAYPKFELSPDEIAELLEEEILPYFSLIKPGRIRLKQKPVDPDDEIFIKAAIAGKVEALISGDSHLLALNGGYKFRIVKPSEFPAERP